MTIPINSMKNINPIVSLQISDGGDPPTVGQNYTLNCHVSGAETIQVFISYKWTKYSNSTESHTLSNSSKLFFSPLRLSNAGNYSCQINVSDVSGLASKDVIPLSKLKVYYS